LFNKIDLYKDKDHQKFKQLKEVYEKVGYKVIGISLKRDKNVESIKDLLKDKITLISGHSGVGKSTFINTIIPHVQIKTQDVSGWSGKGQHTTTFAEMYELPPDSHRDGGKIIDTPGMKEFGLVDIERQELSGYFPEMRERLNECQFNNCLHINEPGCAVKQAVIDGEIDEDRYVSYVNILESIPEKKW
jgi:ribosome biogenesis GTPase